MATLTNTKIKDTYDGLLKTTDNEALDVSGVTLIEDGLGNASALSVGRSGNGVTITGSLNATLATAAQPNITSLGTLSSLSVSGNLAVDTNTLYVDAANNRVGVGTSSPTTKLDIVGSSSADSFIDIIETSGTVKSTFGVFDGGSIGYVGTRSNHDFTIRSNNTERMRIDSSGNVGIGTSNIYGDLHLQGGEQNVIFTSTAADGIAGATIARLISQARGYGNNGAEMASIDFVTNSSSWYKGDIVFKTNNVDGTNPSNNAAERMRIDSSGNVGIGVTPSAPFHLGGTDSTKSYIDRGSATRLQIFQSNDGQSHIGSSGSNAALILRTGTTFGTDTERMRITSTGDVLINGISSLPSATVHGGAYKSSGAVDGGYFSNSTDRITNWSHFLFYNSNGLVGSISTSGSATSYNTSSDYRLKENVVEMTGALDRVDALKPSRFNFIADPEKTVDGFLAHEVAEVVPEAVTGEKDAIDEEGNPIYQGIDQSKIVPLLVGAIKELRAEIELLKAK